MKKLAAIIFGTLLLMSSSFADVGEDANGCGAGSTCGECVNSDSPVVTAAADVDPDATDPRIPVQTSDE